MSNQINLTREELSEWLKEKEQEAEFKEWLHKRRTSELTLDSLLAPVAAAEGKSRGGSAERPQLDYEGVIFPIVEKAGKEGIKVVGICEKAGLDKKLDTGRLRQGLSGEKAKKFGILCKDGTYTKKK